jgi:hypothetical protein
MSLKSIAWWACLVVGVSLATTLAPEHLRPTGVNRAIFFVVLGIGLIALGLLLQRLFKPRG